MKNTTLTDSITIAKTLNYQIGKINLVFKKKFKLIITYLKHCLKMLINDFILSRSPSIIWSINTLHVTIRV